MERRRFLLLDAMALVAATAVGLGLVRMYFMDVNARMPQVFTTWPPITAMHWRLIGIGPLLAAWSLAMIGLQLLPPRPNFRHLARSPGFAASLAGGFGVAFFFAINGLVRFVPWVRGRSVPPFHFAFGDMTMAAVIAIVSAWISLQAGRRWRRRRGSDWRELLALAVALAWIVLYAAQWLTVAFRD